MTWTTGVEIVRGLRRAFHGILKKCRLFSFPGLWLTPPDITTCWTLGPLHLLCLLAVAWCLSSLAVPPSWPLVCFQVLALVVSTCGLSSWNLPYSIARTLIAVFGKLWLTIDFKHTPQVDGRLLESLIHLKGWCQISVTYIKHYIANPLKAKVTNSEFSHCLRVSAVLYASSPENIVLSP